ncbi:Uncharacterized protein HZ326_29987 [Fusarium oxysporum f. sp. albedinis]|nr:Uncharacterized protein HZ326_29987 [Fusarium oxysporum f. sp. albedinis]
MRADRRVYDLRVRIGKSRYNGYSSYIVAVVAIVAIVAVVAIGAYRGLKELIPLAVGDLEIAKGSFIEGISLDLL